MAEVCPCDDVGSGFQMYICHRALVFAEVPQVHAQGSFGKGVRALCHPETDSNDAATRAVVVLSALGCSGADLFCRAPARRSTEAGD